MDPLRFNLNILGLDRADIKHNCLGGIRYCLTINEFTKFVYCFMLISDRNVSMCFSAFLAERLLLMKHTKNSFQD